MRVWHIAAAAIVAFIIFMALLLADDPYRAQDGKEIDVAGYVVCLPHKHDIFGAGLGTDECAIGFRGDDGRHFAISNLEHFGEIPSPEVHARLSGTFTYGSQEPYEKDLYDTVGAIQMKSLKWL